MMKSAYIDTVRLLLDIAPEVFGTRLWIFQVDVVHMGTRKLSVLPAPVPADTTMAGFFSF